MDERTLLQKQLLYRSCHRGCKETDFLLGRFAMAHLYDYSMQELLEYQVIIEANDADLYDWLSGKRAIPQGYNVDIINKIIAFNLTCVLN